MNLLFALATGLLVLTSHISIAGEISGVFASGAELNYSGTVINSGESRDENRRIVFTTSTDTLNGVYEYESATGVLRHVSFFESGNFSETEDARIELTFNSPTSGTYTSSGTFEGEDGSGSFSGAFTSSGNFQITAPDVSHAPTVLDDFNDGTKDGTLWGTDKGSTGALFEECNGRLEFHTPGTGFEEKLRPLVTGKPRYGEDWEVTVDLSNRFAPATETPEAAIGLRIVLPEDPTDFVETALLAYREGSQLVRPVYSLLGNGIEKFSIINSDFAALRLQFDSSRKILHCDYDADGPVNGYSWTRFASYGLDGSAGNTADADWGVSDGMAEFGIALYSYRIGGLDSDGLVSLDDFRSSVGRRDTGETLEEWLVGNYGSSDVPEAALGFDFDLDGLTNLAEFAFGTDPKTFDSVGSPGYSGGAPLVTTSLADGFPRLEIRYTRRKSGLSPGFVYQPEFGSTLSGAWENATSPETVLDLGGGFERATVADHVQGSPSKRFGRVRVQAGGE